MLLYDQKSKIQELFFRAIDHIAASRGHIYVVCLFNHFRDHRARLLDTWLARLRLRMHHWTLICDSMRRSHHHLGDSLLHSHSNEFPA